MKTLILGLLLVTCVFPASAAPATSETMSRIVKHHLKGKYDFDMKDLPVVKDFKEPAAEKSETYQLPGPPHVADYFSYGVILEKKAQRYWIIRSGGFAGQTTVYGPGDAEKLR